jgi:hypothetical protein
MENKKFEVGQRWKGNDGKEKVIFEIDNNMNFIRIIDVESRKIDWHANNEDAQNALVEPWQEPRSGEVWVNVFNAGFPYPDFEVHKSRFNADASASATANQFKTLLACIKMPWKEGKFDECEQNPLVPRGWIAAASNGLQKKREENERIQKMTKTMTNKPKDGTLSIYPIESYSDGLTKRQWYAGQALQGLLASLTQHGFIDYSEFAKDAFMAADAMIEHEEVKNDGK